MTVTGTVTSEVSVRMTSPSTVSPSGLIFDSLTSLVLDEVSVLSVLFSVGIFVPLLRPDWACRVRGSNKKTRSNNSVCFLENTDLNDRCPDPD